MDKFTYIANAHTNVIDDMYQSYKENPESVDITWQRFFEGYDFSLAKFGENGATAASPATTSTSAAISNKEIAVRDLIHAYRSRGHLKSTTNPVRERKDRTALLEIEDFGLTSADLDTEFECGNLIGIGKAPLRKIVASLQEIYTGSVGFEYMYIRKPEIVDWFKEKIEREALQYNPPIEEKKQILSKLNEAVAFENFLHTKYLGQKRFSLEGGETTIPAMDALITKSAELGVEEVVIGMAHRGRLNVLVNIMGKTYEQVFNEFEGSFAPDQTMGDGDVKYHMGFSSQVVTPSGHEVNLKLAPNPSHLEAVNPVVEGFVRSKIDNLYLDSKKAMPILIHGDAALAGQGIGYELIQMSKLDAYATGGTIHFIINNQVGFTTDFDEARSSIYCTDLAKTVDAPVLHVNGDKPEAVVFCMKMAAEYRQKFQGDIFIDMVCYRRHGHNEADEPKFTQPSLYNIISKHANPREIYNKSLIERGDVDASLAVKMDTEFKELLQDRLNMVKQEKLPYVLQETEKEFSEMRLSRPEDFDVSPDTAISQDYINKVGKALSAVPKGFKPIKQIEKVLKQRKEMFFDKKELNWASAELLAYGSLQLDGKVVRMSGQDCKRGTFSHRHAVVRDMNTNAPYSFLDHIEGSERKFNIFNSHLSEFGVLGFEFGYAMADPNAVVIWEAQFGDFANGAQVMIDQFISCSYTKWRRMNSLVMLLPHGYEGQGPEHSNARPERYLQLASGNNMYICNLTKPSNYFHMIRRQMALPFRMPCILMSPKSLFRHPLVVSPLEEFTNSRFQEVIGDDYADAKKVSKVLLCTGKVYFDLLEKQQKDKRKDVAIIRVEQLHPFPKKQVMAELDKYKVDMVHWVQEEPENMGAWSFMLRTFREVKKDVISRKSAASPATGYSKVHKQEQEDIMNAAFA
ncbi:2-oxoglutarate dehydrogenase E1 component [Reichenbachiella agarivorans]|uniref:oxoglutarate dehydrogenase (succinyl-transferring) n=1 Tax=Reichenbachiella agarivorans TaxID=2979464 RepID=A0ABY6CRI8_9BACT|nr:2-oxoglutarate dehydrogenase E1 component [Reichenbachiella agarivorans]UXP33129.1 2-oxoglutarate dehydrogenase E1 component [Reichenbachiella agarivorans]